MRVIGARVKSLREDHGWEVGQLAYKSGVSPAHLYKIENDDRPNASAVIVAKIADALGTTMEYLLGMTNDPRRLPDPTIDVDMDPKHLLRLQELAERAVMRAFLDLLATQEELEEERESR